MKKQFCVFLLILTGFVTLAQSDSVNIEAVIEEPFPADSAEYYDDEYNEAVHDSQGAADSTRVAHRPFSEKTLDELRSDSSLQYKEAPTIAESLWDRFLLWLGQFIDSLFDRAVNTHWGRVLAYGMGVVLLVVIIMMILRVNAFRVFYSGEGASTMQYSVFDENIHEIDFEKEINDAVRLNDYRRGVRLIFLYALKTLSDKQLIQWEQGKTNHDYVAELKAGDVRVGLNELSFYFDYAWYGNFTVTPELFNKVQGIFRDFRGRVQ